MLDGQVTLATDEAIRVGVSTVIVFTVVCVLPFFFQSATERVGVQLCADFGSVMVVVPVIYA